MILLFFTSCSIICNWFKASDPCSKVTIYKSFLCLVHAIEGSVNQFMPIRLWNFVLEMIPPMVWQDRNDGTFLSQKAIRPFLCLVHAIEGSVNQFMPHRLWNWVLKLILPKVWEDGNDSKLTQKAQTFSSLVQTFLRDQLSMTKPSRVL